MRIEAQLTAEQARAVKRMAVEQGVSIGEIIRQSVDRFMRSEAGPSQKELRRRALMAAGALRGGPSDLSEHHDKYVAEALE